MQDLVFRKKLANFFYLSQLLPLGVFHMPLWSLIRGEQIIHPKNSESCPQRDYREETEGERRQVCMHMPLFHIHDDTKLKCPYDGCGKSIDKLTVLTDATMVQRQTYYACPYCLSKVDIMVEDMKIVGVTPKEYPKVFETPAKCVYYPSFQNTTVNDGRILDKCLICPKVLQCSGKRQ